MKRTVDSNWFLHTLNSEELFKNKIGDKLIIFFSLAQIFGSNQMFTNLKPFQHKGSIY